ncbi:MAG: TrmB family transcriptional regulator [Deltaproteobacteria bacterium]|nr:TrmB family transcriptional regulator [Deltaproteobacteria bacterium]MBT7889594.1 TrmB family transcriptional regulator [Deltaproteobacteria bacterium]
MDQELLILNNMRKLGFSEYESKAYLKLLEEFPLNGYTLSKNSGIPRSRIYEVLKNLMDKQLVFEQIEEKNKLYFPVDPDIFINKLKTQYEDVFNSISNIAGRIYKEKKQDDRLVVISGRKNIISFLNLLIKGAEKRVAISIWDEEIKDLNDELEKAIERGVALKGIYFGEENPFEMLVSHRRVKRYIAEKKERYISIIIDGTHTISGIVSRGENSKVTWTQDEGFIEISEDYIAHDLLVNLYSASLDEDGYKLFEEFTDNVHNQFYGYTSEELGIYKGLR